MIDVGVITDEISQDIEESLEVMRRCDVSISEIRAVWGKNSADLDASELARLRQLLSDAGSSVCAISSPFFKCDLYEDRQAARGRLHEARDMGLSEQMNLLERLFNVAETLGTRNIRVFTFWRTEDPTPEIEDRIVAMFEKPVALAEKRGVRLLIENEHACFLGTGAETTRVLKRFDSEAIGAVWDPGNAFCAGEQPYPDGYEAIRPWIRHIHIKDARRDSAGEVEFVKVGEGVLDYPAQIARLKTDGYDGVLSLETHYALEDGGKAAASEESLKSLAALVRGV